MREKVIDSILENKLIVIVRGVDKEALIPLAEAMYAGGVRLLEITYDAKGVTSDEETAASIAMLAKHFEGRMFIGAGTVLNEKQVKLTRDAGGLFIISPDTNEYVIKKSVELGMVSIPGALTPSEITAAHRAGADFIKLFPITNMGIEYVKAVRAPLSHLKLLAVGGVTLENINEYLDTGVCGFGISSGIVDKKLIAAKDFDGITALAKSYVEKL
jgi:2-dehydro-3-deoxyphosphogluconate aldolase/(4S)-4-hydroxy-2-oxoglutarate aldolase